MKNFYLIAVSGMLASFQGFAQDGIFYKPVQVAISFGVAFQTPGQTGVIFNINPSYTIAGRYKAGIEFEEAMYHFTQTGSSSLTFDYYFLRTRFLRLTAGGGYGFYKNSFLETGCDPGTMNGISQIQTSSGKMGGMLRLGFERHHLSFRVAYHFVPTMYQITTVEYSPTVIDTYKNGYWGITLGIIIGGGKK
jgi:hypothetical protein